MVMAKENVGGVDHLALSVGSLAEREVGVVSFVVTGLVILDSPSYLAIGFLYIEVSAFESGVVRDEHDFGNSFDCLILREVGRIPIPILYDQIVEDIVHFIRDASD